MKSKDASLRFKKALLYLKIPGCQAGACTGLASFTLVAKLEFSNAIEEAPAPVDTGSGSFQNALP
ncbi:MAG: hypothetical protein HC840_05905, partial [Leptolyngbyaceae cyanobacterium RM2_2_4]|nr:hypothetical protein [Leptolyngbyaceae cyanobacterium RM2_2_4]